MAKQVLGQRAYASIDETDAAIELVIIATPAPTMPNIIESCGRYGVKAAIVITAGFAESGPDGQTLEQTLLAAVHRHRIRLIGPNCLGIMRPYIGLNATLSRGIRSQGEKTITSAMLGELLPNLALRTEFLALAREA